MLDAIEFGELGVFHEQNIPVTFFELDYLIEMA